MRLFLTKVGVAAFVLVGCNGILGLDRRPLRQSAGGGAAAAGGGTGGPVGVGGDLGGGGVGASSGPGSVGGAGGVGGSVGGAGGAEVVAQSCGALVGATTGIQQIDPDLDGPIPPFDAHCDMDFDGGGWTLILATADGMGPTDGTEGVVLPGSNTHMPTATMLALAMVSSQVHLRSAGQAATRSATSPPDSLPIVNLRLGKMLERTAAAYSDAHWVMGSALSHANMTRINMSQQCADAEAADRDYPDVYHACNNENGLHLLGGLSTWNLASSPPEPLELYIR